jgi:hypothetical protein
MRRGTSGQVLVEVLVVVAALCVALLLPFIQGRSAASLLLTTLVSYLRAQSYLLSIL